jgi:hypothetical protein
LGSGFCHARIDAGHCQIIAHELGIERLLRCAFAQLYLASILPEIALLFLFS